jgi:hypothetical protein
MICGDIDPIEIYLKERRFLIVCMNQFVSIIILSFLQTAASHCRRRQHSIIVTTHSYKSVATAGVTLFHHDTCLDFPFQDFQH